LNTAEETLGKAIQDLRALSKSLNNEWLEKFDLIENLSAETHRINAARTMHVSLYCSGKKMPLPASGQVMLFRIIQEALQNSIKHGEPEIIRIYLQAGPELIDVNIIDDGKGMPAEPTGKHGMGMLNMQHRSRLLGGSIHWRSIPGEGTQVHIILPILKSP
jgi:signal transduction histidine kinase